jgi:CRISPR-associated protein Cas1
MQNLRILPKLRDSLSYLYIEHAIIDKNAQAIEYVNEDGRVMVPVAALSLLLLGPGTSITHAAVRTLAENGCTINWVGEDAMNFYAQGFGETRKGYHLLHQAKMASDPQLHMEVVTRMYRFRFNETIGEDLSLPQLRGMEGVRVREAYAEASRKYGVEWSGRRYDRNNWQSGDPINRALSAANSLVNGVCQSAIVSGGYSTAIGFIHTGKQLSFVFDVADLYKIDYCVPLAFEIVSQSTVDIEKRVRQACREKFREVKLLDRILTDIDELLMVPVQFEGDFPADEDKALPEPLWGTYQEV